MLYLSAKTKFAILGVIFALVLVAIAWDVAHQGSPLQVRPQAVTGGDPRRGAAMFIQYGCGSCHSLANVRSATGNVGPPLDGIATRAIVAGHLANNPKNMERWIRDPQHVSPGTAMPNLAVSQGDARDMTAFLYTRR
jgi:cytochrome c2